MLRLQSRRVVCGHGDSLRVEPGWIDMDGASIVATGHGPPPSDDVETRDFGGRLIAPAFVNAHTHVALAALRGSVGDATSGNVVEDLFYRVEAHLTPEDVRAFARMGAWESLLAGVGLVWDHYFFGEALADGIADTGLAAVVGPTVQDLGGPGKDRWESQLDATLRLASDPRPGVFAALAPHATDTVSDDLFGRVATLAETHGLPVHMHLAQSPEEYARARERHDTSPWGMLERLGLADRVDGVFAHALYVRRRELKRVSDRHTFVACPYAQLQFGFPAPVDEWQEAGVPWVVATDCAASNDSMSLRKELRFVAGFRTLGTGFSPPYHRFLDGTGDPEAVWNERQEHYARLGQSAVPRCLLDRVWSRAGRLHPGFRAGCLEPGALANVVVWDLEHPAFWPARDVLSTLTFGDVDGAIHAMFVTGREIGVAGDFVRSIVASDVFQSHREEASRRLSAILAWVR